MEGLGFGDSGITGVAVRVGGPFRGVWQDPCCWPCKKDRAIETSIQTQTPNPTTYNIN